MQTGPFPVRPGDEMFALDTISTETLVVGIVPGEVAVFPDLQLAVATGVGYTFVLAHVVVW